MDILLGILHWLDKEGNEEYLSENNLSAKEESQGYIKVLISR